MALQTPSLPDPRAFLLRLPPEVISRILLSLSPRDIISCRRTCSRLYYLCNDTLLRYLVQMERSAVNDDIRPGLSYRERLRILEKREEAWATLDFRRTVHVTVPFDSTGTYDFTSGTILLGTSFHRSNRQLTFGYSYFPLPSLSDVQDQKTEWKEFGLGMEISDVGLAVYEHDLLAALTTTTDEDDSSGPDNHMTLECRFLSFSTGRPHPLAEEPIIFITKKSTRLGPCDVLIEIVGDFLALLITFPWSRGENDDEFFLVRWKKGEIHRFQTSSWGASPCFSFLSQDTLVVPNLIQNTLELFKIVVDSDNDDAPRLIPLCVLNLPPLNERASIVRLGCRAEPNPIGSSGALAIPAPSSRPFRDKAEDAIMLFSMLIEDVPPEGDHLHYPETNSFTFIMHRRALAAQIPAEHRACAPYCCSVVPAEEPVQVPWEAWGVAATRWFEGGDAWTRWITTTAGQRAVMMEGDPPTPITVRDFNPYAVHAARARSAAAAATAGSASGQSSREQPQAQQGRNWSEPLPNGNRMTLKVEESVLPAGNKFQEDVRSALPYVEVVTRDEYSYEGVLIDEERILGLKTDREDEIGISSFDVLILG
ncbi:hypothetical protein BJV74DRAFT_85796 [Russula compacta]|nr:hypothetical protein BJV74DRAFT_85796 [Russula compacta]